MKRLGHLVASGLVVSSLAACGTNSRAPSASDATVQKGTYGVHYVVSVSRPVGGHVKSADGRIDCGTAGGSHDLCGPITVAWSASTVLSAYPDAGLHFQSWAGDCGGSVAASGCVLDTADFGADKWVAAVFNPPERLGHSTIPDPAQHAPLFLAFVRTRAIPDPAVPQCTRCHGADYGGIAIAPSCTGCHARGSHASAGHPTWLQDCDFCHGSPPATPTHADVAPGNAAGCAGCHPDTVLASGAIDASKGKHMNGRVEASAASCSGCHGFPPATGAHLAHYGVTEAELAGAAGSSGYGNLDVLETRFPAATPVSAPAKYAFGCGHCHPTDPAQHSMSTGPGSRKVVLYEATSPAGSLKARNAPSAAFDAATGTCSGVYCHSSGNEGTPTFATAPGWSSGANPGCAGCHGNPPRYPSGGPGSATANGHLGLNAYGDPWTHLAGLPAPSVGIYKHGGWYGPGANSSMTSCQTCHFGTTDPANTGPSGYYYLDTTVDLDGTGLGGLAGFFSCTACHTNGDLAAPTRAGKVLPLRHVNGSRDVEFDARTTLPAFDWLPYPPDRPARPFWFTVSYGAAEWDRTLVSWTRDPLGGTSGASAQFDLAAARYEPATKTCTNVACHMSQGSTRFNPGGPVPVTTPIIPLIWGDPYGGNPGGCRKCHALDPAFAN